MGKEKAKEEREGGQRPRARRQRRRVEGRTPPPLSLRVSPVEGIAARGPITVICCLDEGGARLSGSVKFSRRDRGTGHEGELQMNQRTSWVSHAVAALATLATVAFVPAEAQL